MRATIEQWDKAIERIFNACGLREDCSKATAYAVVRAEARGVYSHGIGLIDVYVNEAQSGYFNPDPTTKIISERAASAVIDGDKAVGHYTALEAMKIAMDKAKTCGSATVMVRNCNHYGAGLPYVLKACENGMIAWMYCNTDPCMAPWGGTKKFIGTNPYTFGTPAGKYAPFVLDMATTAAAYNKILHFKVDGKPVPEGWGLDSKGRPTTVADDIINGGSMLPFGGIKGYGIATMVDIIGGVLSGEHYGYDVHCRPWAKDDPANVGYMINVIDVAAYMDLAEYNARMEDYLDLLHACPKADGVEAIYYAGEKEGIRCQKAKDEGIDIEDMTLKNYLYACEKTGLDPEAILKED